MNNASSKIVLIGFMGCGKTTVAKLLAADLGLPCLDTDEEILKSTNFKTIADLFAQDGEDRFRTLEAQLADSLRSKTNLVISSGGGMVIDPANYAALKTGGQVVYLETDFEILRERIEAQMKESKISRPLFTDIAEAKKRYDLRLPLYRQRADFLVSTDHKSPQTVATEIAAFLKASVKKTAQ